MRLRGAEIIAECLIEQGVDTVFGYPGGQIIDVYDALYAYSDRIHHVLTAHEQGAAHAADGYARASGRTGVVIATSGPGATNLVTGLATAHMDSIPLVAITGNVGSPLLGKDSFQEIDIFGVTMPITKHNFIVRDVRELADTLRRAFRIAASGRPGPVLIDVLKDVQQAQTEFTPETPAPIAPITDTITEADMAAAARLIDLSERPVLFAGGGVIASNASEALRRFAARIGAPVSLSLMGLGAFPADEPAYLGMLGMHGTRASAAAVSHADLLIVCGARLSDRVIMNAKTFAPHLRILHLDIDPAEINKNVLVQASVQGDLRAILEGLCPRVAANARPDWARRIAEWKASEPQRDCTGLAPRAIINAARRALPPDALIATDVGQHQMWVAQGYPFTAPRTLLTSGGLGTMSYGLGAAIGAQKAQPDRRVLLFTGDGSFQMNCNELVTVATNDLPIVIVLLNNGVLGMVRQWQKVLYGQRYSQTTTHRRIDYVKLAGAYGIQGYQITDPDALAPTLEAAIALNRPALIEIVIDPDENVLPMVAPGKSYTDQITRIDREGGAQ
ncbi:MAG: biosynthetic-type acetolactate synthase large subunit [Oscillospiraceae bacterium]|nr:biosynthetic-type acetolactate synthase large subunit [Oscillospiraceae bacterium]